MFKDGEVKVVLFSVFFVAFAVADTLTLQQGLNGFSGFFDTYIVMSTDSAPHLSQELVVEGYHCSACIDERALMRVDLTSLDKKMTITKAELQLFSPSQPRPGSGVVEVYKMTQPWADSEANWFNATKSAKWSKAGGDFLSAGVAAISYGTQVNVWHTFDVTKAIRDFVADPASNLGLMLKLDPAMLTVTYVSSQGTQEKRPKLVLTYTTSAVSFSPSVPVSSRSRIEPMPSGMYFGFSQEGSHHIKLSRINGEMICDRWVSGGSYTLGMPNLSMGPYMAQISGDHERYQKEIIVGR